ncbi:PriCT-2 domain-containing protein [Vibrio parahaemolyticus]|nr:PriCT-2 domain-containing protein [Vibrio parahaemolyticus]
MIESVNVPEVEYSHLHERYTLIPWFDDLNKPAPFKDGKQYPYKHPNWMRASNQRVGVRLDRLVLIDWDGYKEDEATPYDVLASSLGMNEDELINHCSQWNDDSSSLHFLFELPEHVELNSIKHSNDGHWLKGVDVKTGNQLFYIKAGKHNRLDDFQPATVPSVILDTVLKKHESNNRPRAISHSLGHAEAVLSKIDSDCDYQTWCNVIAGTVHEFGHGEDVIDILDNWSMSANNYKGRHDVENKAHSFNREGGFTWGGVKHIAGVTRAQQKTIRPRFGKVDKSNVISLPVTHDGIPSIFPDVKMQRNGNKVLSTNDNLKALLNELGVQVATNQMNLNMDAQRDNTIHEWQFDELRSFLISEAEKSGLPKVAIDEHLIAIAIKNSYHPIEAHFTDKQWDGIPRVQRVIDCIPSNNRRVRDLVMRKWFVSAIAAIYQRGFSTKLVPVLKGSQSAMKSAFLNRVCSILPNSFLGESDLNADDVDSVIRVLSHHIVELAELERTTKREAGSLKAFITNREDKFRKKYGRSDTAKARQTVFIATVNDEQFFKDETGNTRFAVIELNGAIDMEQVNNILGYSWNNGRLTHDSPHELEQFWLEIKSWFDSGESWMLTNEEQQLTESVNNKFVVKSQYYDDILERISMFDSSFGMKSTQVADRMGLPKGYSGRVGRALNDLVRDGYLRQGTGRDRRSYYKA